MVRTLNKKTEILHGATESYFGEVINQTTAVSV